MTFACLIISGTLSVNAQTFEEARKKEEENLRKFKQQEDAGLGKMKGDFQDYVKMRDKEFSDFLKKEWKSYKVQEGKKVPEKPNPVTIPVYKPKPDQTIPGNRLIPSRPLIPRDTSQVPEPLPVPPVRKPEIPDIAGTPVTIDFYGEPVHLVYDPSFLTRVTADAGKEGISVYWEKTSSSNYSSLVERLLEQKELMNLNDYSYYLLVKELAESLYPGNESGQVLSTWFLMLRSGYGVRLATENGNIVLLLPSKNTIYSTSFLSEGGMKYYIMSRTGGQLYTYDKDYTEANHSVDFNIYSPMDLGNKTADRNLKFEYMGKSYQAMIHYQTGLINIYNDFPQLDMAVYLNAAVSQEAKESIAASLRPMLEGMSDEQAVNFLLSFVQHSFAYKTDPEQFGREKFFFAEEVFFYPYSDCEDRAVLFSYLVRELLGFRVVGLEYPEHMATAVQFPGQNVPGDYITYENSHYVIADPTYIGASAGITMPDYRGVSPSVIPVNNISEKTIRNKR
jgi:hypothetical protein